MFDSDRELSPRTTVRMVEQQGQERTLEQRQRDVYETHRHRTFAVAYYMTGNEVTAEEVLSDTFVRAFQKQEEPDARIVDTAMVDELRQRLPIDEVAAAMDPLEASRSRGLEGRNVRRTDLEESLRELPSNERLVFLLRDVEGYSADKVAELIEVPRAQVERTLLSARLRMRGWLARQSRQSEAA